ncbi:hypothetical protein ACFPM7_07905 [Actinokineospora guangxiensis]|uniref:Cytochrome C biogenesis protein transmembrane region n=1 Tax=Actinokineospora guangxiensis TaxID=1490288 RepID=A0ABW0EJ74_9PSEU
MTQNQAVDPALGEQALPARRAGFVHGHFPRHKGRVIAVSALIGFLLTVVWSAEFVDHVIGDSVANTILGHDAKATPITGVLAGTLFAFVSGLAGTFTACNIAAFGAVAPLLGDNAGRGERVRRALPPLGWLSAGMLAVSVVYGALVGLVGTGMPQFATTRVPGTIPGFLVQSMVVYGLIGLFMLWLGLAAAGVARDPLGPLTRRWPNAPMVVMGVLIGLFLVGRPYPLFRQMFRDAAESGNPLYGAAAFSLQSIGNIIVLAVLFLALTYFLGARMQRWLSAEPTRTAKITAVSLVSAGVFLVLYWDVRLLQFLDLISWYPVAPWT